MNLRKVKNRDIEKISDVDMKELDMREKEEDYSLEDVNKYLEVNSVINNV